MAYVILPSRRKRPDIFELDHGHPLAQGLVFGGLGIPSGIPNPMSIKDLSKYGANCPVFNSAYTPKTVYSDVIGRRGINCDYPSTSLAAYKCLNISTLNTTGMTLSCFVYLVNKANAPFYKRSSFYLSVEQYYLKFSNISTYSVTVPNGFLYNRFVHVAATYDGNYDRIYVDGELFAERENSGSTPTSPYELWIGGSTGWTSYSAGNTYDPIVYNRALSQEEIAILANKTDPMLAGMIRDKKPAPKHWFMPIPNDCKVKNVVPVRMNSDWTTKPPHHVQLRKDGHWALDGLVVAVPANKAYSKGLYNAVTRSTTAEVSATVTIDNNFITPRFGGNIGANVRSKSSIVGTEGTMILGVPRRLYSYSIGSRGAMCSYGEAFTGNGVRIGSLSTASSLCIVLNGSESDYFSFGGWPAFTVIAASWSKDDDYVQGFIDGNIWNGTKVGTGAYGTYNTNAFYVGGSGISYRCWGRPISWFLAYDKVLTPSEIKSLSINPWQIYDSRPIKRTIYSFASKHNIMGTQDANTLNWTWGE